MPLELDASLLLRVASCTKDLDVWMSLKQTCTYLCSLLGHHEVGFLKSLERAEEDAYWSTRGGELEVWNVLTGYKIGQPATWTASRLERNLREHRLDSMVNILRLKVGPVMHNEHQPALMISDFHSPQLLEMWLQKGLPHRDQDLPALTIRDWSSNLCLQAWMQEGKLHRKNGPALVYTWTPSDMGFNQDLTSGITKEFWQRGLQLIYECPEEHLTLF